MIAYLDTDICVFALKNRFPSIQERLQSSPPDRIKIPAIVKAELLLGAQQSRNPAGASHVVEEFLRPFEVIPFCDRCAMSYARIRSDVERRGVSIGPNDLLIAATTLTNQGTLVTHNTKEYGRIPGLPLQDWTQEE